MCASRNTTLSYNLCLRQICCFLIAVLSVIFLAEVHFSLSLSLKLMFLLLSCALNMPPHCGTSCCMLRGQNPSKTARFHTQMNHFHPETRTKSGFNELICEMQRWTFLFPARSQNQENTLDSDKSESAIIMNRQRRATAAERAHAGKISPTITGEAKRA